MNTFVDGGLGSALIQKKNADDLDFSSVFYFNLVACVVLYLVMFAMAPFIAKFYNNDALTWLIRVLCITILISGVKGIQSAYVSRNMLFKRFFYATLGGTILSAFVGIILAYNGFGAWALVAQYLSNATVDTIVLWVSVKWRPRRAFSAKRLMGLLSFGWKILASNLVVTVYDNLRSLIIGKKYSSADLAQYEQGRKLPFLIVYNINSAIDSVLFPMMAEEQENPERLKEMTRQSIKIGTYVMAPLMLGMFFCAESIVKIVLSSRWLPCVPFLRIFSISYLLYPIQYANLNAIKAMGYSQYILRLEIIKKTIGIVLLVVAMRFDVFAIAVAFLLSNVMEQIINSWPNRKLLRYSYWEQLRDIFPSVLMSCVMGCCVWNVEKFDWNCWQTLFVQVVLGGIIYLLLSIILQVEELQKIKQLLRHYLTSTTKNK